MTIDLTSEAVMVSILHSVYPDRRRWFGCFYLEDTQIQALHRTQDYGVDVRCWFRWRRYGKRFEVLETFPLTPSFAASPASLISRLAICYDEAGARSRGAITLGQVPAGPLTATIVCDSPGYKGTIK